MASTMIAASISQARLWLLRASGVITSDLDESTTALAGLALAGWRGAAAKLTAERRHQMFTG